MYPPNSIACSTTAVTVRREARAGRPTRSALTSCADYAARYCPTRATTSVRTSAAPIGDDVLIGVPAGQVADARTATLGGSPDGATIFNAGDGDDRSPARPATTRSSAATATTASAALAATTAASKARPATTRVWGGDGDDVLFGRYRRRHALGRGRRRLPRGRPRRDGLSGGEGDDRLFGGHDRDRLKGGAGDDELWPTTARPTSSTAGPGDDVAQVDRRDKVVGCEHVISPRSAKRAKRR